MIKVAVSKILKEALDNNDAQIKSLIGEFKDYKEGKRLPDIFGKDVRYDHAHTLAAVKAEDIFHIHLSSNCFPTDHRQENRTSDDHLVYCSNFFNSDSYLLMAILQPDAHEQAKDNNVMLNLAEMANHFRNLSNI